MLELTSNRNNPGIDPTLHVWGWEIPVYLFLGGLVAGLLVLGGYHILRGDKGPRAAWPFAPLLGVVLLSAGMGALFLDLGHKLYVWRMYLTFQVASPMSWGAWILFLVYPALLGAALLHPPEASPVAHGWLSRVREWSKWLHERPGLVRAIGWANLAGGVAMGVYTGVLLGSLAARPLWNSAILGPLFLTSGVSTAAALMHLLSSVERPGPTLGLLFRVLEPEAGGHAMLRADSVFIAVELGLLGLWILGLASSAGAGQEAVKLVLSGDYAPAFWSLVVITGLLVPLAIQVAELRGHIRHTVTPAVLVLVGGLALRWILVDAGQVSRF